MRRENGRGAAPTEEHGDERDQRESGRGAAPTEERSDEGRQPEQRPRPSAASIEPRRRLHPLSPLLRSAKLIAVLIAALSWQGYAQLGFARFLAVVVVGLLGSIALSFVSWWVTGYHVVGRELRIYEGLVSRRTRAIPLERLQAVDVVRPVLARLTGLAELKIEVIGAEKAEAPLAYLTTGEAVTLRDRLLRLSSRTPEAATTSEPPPERLIHAVDNGDVLLGQLLTPQLWFVPIGILLVIVQFAFSPVWTFIGLASLLTATIGVVQQPVRRVLDDWGFRVALGPAGLRLRGGLLETRTQTVPPHRIQAIGVTWPLLWRVKGWLRCRVDVAGYGGEERASVRGGRLLPVGTFTVGQHVIAEVLPGVDLAAFAATRVDHGQTRDISDTPMARLSMINASGSPPRRAKWVAPLRWRVLGVGLTDRVFATRDGLVTRELVIVPYARIQSVRVVQGPLQRRLRLASVHTDTAGGLHAVAAHRDLGEAWALAAELATRAQTARDAAPGQTVEPSV